MQEQKFFEILFICAKYISECNTIYESSLKLLRKIIKKDNIINITHKAKIVYGKKQKISNLNFSILAANYAPKRAQ